MRLNYKTKKALSQEETSQKDIKLAVEKAKLQLASDILATKSAISDAADKLDELKTTYPLDTPSIVENMAKLESLQDGLKKLEELKDELGL